MGFYGVGGGELGAVDSAASRGTAMTTSARWTSELQRCCAGRRARRSSALAVCAPGSARAQDEDDSIWNLDQTHLSRCHVRSRVPRQQRAGDRIPRAFAPGRAAEPQPAAAAGQCQRAAIRPGRRTPTARAARSSARYRSRPTRATRSRGAARSSCRANSIAVGSTAAAAERAGEAANVDDGYPVAAAVLSSVMSAAL